jgi:hypothetical protein
MALMNAVTRHVRRVVQPEVQGEQVTPLRQAIGRASQSTAQHAVPNCNILLTDEAV